MSYPRIGLVLGAGGARGIAHIPVIEALDDLGIRPAAVAGASIGAIIGAGVAAGLSAAEVRERFLAVFGSRSSALAKLWQLRPRRIADLMVADNYGLGKLDPQKVLSVFVGDAIPARFADLAIPFTAVATDFYGGEEVRFTEGDLPSAVAASMALPGLFRPVLIDGRVMIDGGVMNPVPTNALPADLDLVIAVDVVSFPEPRDDRPLPTGIDTVVGAAQLMMQLIIAEKLRERPPDILVRAPVGPFHALDFLKSRQMLEAAAPMREEVKRRLTRQIEAPQARPVLTGP